MARIMNESLHIQKLSPADVLQMQELLTVFQVAFEMKRFDTPSTAYLEKLLANPDFLVWIARKDDKVVGGITGYVLHQYYAERPLAYVYDLAVLSDYQRQGIGTQLMSAFRSYGQAAGFEEVFVQADVIDDYALDFYRSTHPTAEESVVHFNFTLADR